MLFSLSLALAASCIALGLHLVLSRKDGRLRPPGPTPLPIIGNLLSMPKTFQWIKFRDMSLQYGSDIIYLTAPMSSMVILNSYDDVNELFEKRSSIYSGRIFLTMLLELMDFGWGIPFMPYGDLWRAGRKLMHRDLGTMKSVRVFDSKQVWACQNLLPRLLEDPDQWQRHLRHYMGSLMIDSAYGIDVLPENDPCIAMVEETLEKLSIASNFGTFLVDLFPILKYIPSWVPGAGFQNNAKSWKKLADTGRQMPYDLMKDAIANSTARSSFASKSIEDMNPHVKSEVQEELIRDVAANIYLSGVDTTTNTAKHFMLAMSMYPEVQAKAQAELDEVFGKYQLPSLDDYDSLPYLTAVVKETLRWLNVAPLGVPHLLEKDDEYRGYILPKGSLVFSNTWAILHNDKMYPDPFTFQPERFLKDGKLNFDSVLDPELAAFGFGRRICPGMYLASSALWLMAGSILSRFNINGPVYPKHSSAEIGLPPDIYECAVKPRSAEAHRLILELVGDRNESCL